MLEVIFVGAVVALAVGYTGRKAWKLFRPGAKGGSCCSKGASGGCEGCPLAKR